MYIFTPHTTGWNVLAGFATYFVIVSRQIVFTFAAILALNNVYAADVIPPQLLEWDFTPKTVDVTTQAQQVTVTFRVTDNSTGVRTPSIAAGSVDTAQITGFASMELISGGLQDGVWRAQLTVPAQSAPGQWKISLFPLEDLIGNSTRSFGPGVGFPSEFTVISGTGEADVTPPQLLEWDFTPKTVDVTTQAQQVTVTFRVADNSTGVQSPLIGASSVDTTQSTGFASMELISGGLQDGVWRAQLTVPAQSAPGQWKISLFPLVDLIGNSTSSFGPGAGFPSEFTVISGTGTVRTGLVAALLPASRSVQVGNTATAFASVINTGGAIARNCGISLRSSVLSAFSYQTTDPSTNALNGTPDTPVDIAVGRLQTFVLAFTPIAAFSPTEVQFNLDCTNTDPAPVVFGLNTLLLSASSTPVPDIVALSAAPSGDGVIRLPGTTASNAFAVATVNVGSASTITTSADTGSSTLSTVLSICETNSITGICFEPPAASVTTTISANATPTFSVFVNGMGLIPFDPANNRIHVRFKDGDGVTRGSTSVAVSTQ